ncbi:MAG TPA: acyltransferase [Pirellulales bacterium]|jgi:acetyltransferase-like isoleucine patch superfamily enzyme|nr:acyltransferase [Pirellulales bacterium]
MSIVAEEYFVHDLAICESKQIGLGTRIWAYCHVLPGATIGSHCNLGEHVFVENKVSIGDRCTIKNGVALWDFVTLEEGVFVGPCAVFTNDLRPRAFIRRDNSAFLRTQVNRGATIGANSTLVCGMTIGQYALVGAGTVVTHDVPPHALVVGNPGRVIGRVCFCGAKLDARDYCAACQLLLTANSEQQAVRLHQQTSRN